MQLSKNFSLAELTKSQTAERNKNSSILYKCIKSKAELEKNIDGSLSIKKLILE